MISGTCGQEVGVYYDVSEMYAVRVGAAGLAEAKPGTRRSTRRGQANEEMKTANEVTLLPEPRFMFEGHFQRIRVRISVILGGELLSRVPNYRTLSWLPLRTISMRR